MSPLFLVPWYPTNVLPNLSVYPLSISFRYRLNRLKFKNILYWNLPISVNLLLSSSFFCCGFGHNRLSTDRISKLTFMISLIYIYFFFPVIIVDKSYTYISFTSKLLNLEVGRSLYSFFYCISSFFLLFFLLTISMTRFYSINSWRITSRC